VGAVTDLEVLLRAVDALSPSELNQLHDYVELRRRTTWWVVESEQLAQIDALMRPVQREAELMSDTEIDAAIADAIAEVRRERENSRRD
jgi:hypothetical protein